MCVICGNAVMYHLLAFIVALVMTWTVETKSSVSGSGDVPVSVVADYTCSYQKGTVLKDGTASLKLTGMDDLEVTKVVLYLKSNQKTGAGVLSLSADGTRIAQRSGTMKELCGAYDNENYHTYTLWTGRRTSSQWEIQINGTENSLYIEKFVITYTPPSPRTVSLMYGDEAYDALRETTGKSGVVLPSLADLEDWAFVGWTPMECWNIDFRPEVYAGGTRYYPQSDITLWALWEKIQVQDTNYMVTPQSGDYLYVETTMMLAMAGEVQNNGLLSEQCNLLDKNQIYTITFTPTYDSATIYHPLTDSYVGYSEKRLVDEPSFWSVFYDGERTLFYMSYKDQLYLLYPSFADADWNVYTGLMPIKESQLLNASINLITAPEEYIPIYTAHPECGMNIAPPAEETQEQIVPMGVYELHILKGKKYLRLRN